MSHKMSNLYASRSFSEHPLALWPLDDEVYFISMLNEANKDILTWTLNNTQQELSLEDNTIVPMPEEISSIISPISSSVNYMELLSPSINLNLIADADKDTISISSFMYPFESLIESVEIGFAYKNNEDAEYTYDTSVMLTQSETWNTVSHTAYVVDKDIFKGYIKINYSGNFVNSDYSVKINSLSIGQWSELFVRQSSGITPVSIPDQNLNDLIMSSGSLNVKVVEADAYGLLNENSAYYFVENNKMLAVNYGIPMVFGSGNVTKIYKSVNPSVPSVALPGHGFLNKKGIGKNYTVEFWLRMYTNSASPIRIFGPLTSTDGLYVEEEFLTIRIGRYSKSHFIGKWFRPMLVHLQYSEDSFNLLINGDTVALINIEKALDFIPLERNDWLGFYGHEKVYPFEIDCFSIYPYIIPNQLAKKKYVYGQGVDEPENIINNFGGESVYINFPFANYSSTMNYPDMTGWNAGFSSNIDTTSKYISFPKYTVPEYVYVGDNLEIFDLNPKFRIWNDLTDNTWEYWNAGSWEKLRRSYSGDTLHDSLPHQDGDYKFVKLKPNLLYEDINGSIYFDSMNPIDSLVKSIFGVFRSPDQLPAEPEIVMQFTSKVNFNNFRIEVDTSGLSYYYNELLLNNKALTASTDFIAGIELDKINSTYASSIQNFFASPQNLSLNIGGYEANTFTGRIYKVNFNNKFYTDKDLLEYILDDGTFQTTTDENIMKYIGNYTYHFLELENTLIEDIGSVGYWEDSLPLSYFAKNVLGQNGKTLYDLDMLQFNIDTTSPLVNTVDPVGAEENSLKVSTYITIQDYTSVGKKLYTEYTNTVKIGEDRVLDIDQYTYNDIINTKFEVVDGTIIFPPKEQVNFEDYYITTHIELKTNGLLNKDIRLKSMSFSSLAYDEKAFYSITTKGGNKIYPFHKIDDAYVFKTKNPFRIYKDSTSYMHLTGDSGISVLPYNINGERGITIPINSQKSPAYSLGGIQLFLFYNKYYTIESNTKVARIKTFDNTFDIWLEKEVEGKRGFIKIYNAITGVEDKNSTFYQDGQQIKNPVIEPLTWSSISISLFANINLDASIGQLELYPEFLYNNIALYNKSYVVYGKTLGSKNWNEIKTSISNNPELENPIVNNPWTAILNGTWKDALFKEEVASISVDGEQVYQSLFGISRIVTRDTSLLSVNSDSFRILSDANWKLYEGKVV